VSLAIGTKLGPYEIVAPLGAGEMGEVYRATDSNLKRSVAAEGGLFPLWSATAHELLFGSLLNSKVMFAPYAVVGDSFRADKPQVWSPTGYRGVGNNYPYAIHPDGKRLAIIAAQDQAGVVQDKVVFVFNFFEYLWKIAPRKK
jgi:serine/threonine protein kinase